MPKTHIKPTIKELDEKIVKSIEKLDKPSEEEVTQPSEEVKEDKTVSETPPVSPSIEAPQEEPKEEPQKEEEEEPKVDFKKKLKASSAEAQLLYSKDQKILKALEVAGDVPEPTEEELIKEYPDWDVMSDFEKKLAKKDMINTRKFDAIKEATKEFKDIDAWGKKVDDFLADPENLVANPELEGLEEDFRIFSTKPTRKGLDFEDLVSAFLYMNKKEEKPKTKGSMFPTGSPGMNERPHPKSDKITISEARRLRITDYKKYLSYVTSGKIEIEEI